VAGLRAPPGTTDQIVPPPVPLADLAGGQTAATAICAALLRRERTGEGCVLDVSLTESALALQAMHLPGANAGAASERGQGMLTGGLASYRPYRCADGEWLAVGPIEPKFFAALCTAIERPDLVELQYDPTAQDELRTQLEQVFATRAATAWEQLLVGVGGGDACVVRVLHPRELPQHPQLLARGAVMRVPDVADDAWMPASPYVVDGVRSDSE
jgi:crotonobetainyl-CoA:carnitine CoA-transferase CaiB-like acyl-CoA transferase